MKYKLISKVLMMLLLLCSVGCGSSDPEASIANDDPSEPPINSQPDIRTLQIRDHRQECVGVAVFPCLYVKSPDESDWSLFYDAIEGFDYEWGFNYELSVSVTPIGSPLADGSSLRYTLLDTISKTPVAVGSTFLYSSRFAREVVTKQADTKYSLFSFASKEFVCKPSDCELIDSLLLAGQAILFEFRHPDKLTDALILEEVVCSSNQTQFSENCLNF